MSLPKNLTVKVSSGGPSKFRRLVKTGLASGLHRTGADRLLDTFTGVKNMPLVVLYHRVVENLPENGENGTPGMMISRRTLEHHLDWIGRRYRFVSLDELG